MAVKRGDPRENGFDVETIKQLSTPKFLKPLQLVTENQKKFYDVISESKNKVIMCHAPAGCGKTHIALYKGLELLFLKSSPIKRILVINPTVDVGREDPIGFLPGTIEAKIGMYNESADFIFRKLLPETELAKRLENGTIQYRTLNFLRGTNLEDSFIVMDEAQNASPLQLKTLMSRINDQTKLVIQGDLSQCDKYKDYRHSGFFDVWYRLKDVRGCDYAEFSPDDIMRSQIVKDIMVKYWKEDKIILNGFT